MLIVIIKKASRLASAFKVNAIAPDGAIEGFEDPNKTFFVGVMWHPEFLVNPCETLLWEAFIQAANTHKSH